jgi:hypothetical protein
MANTNIKALIDDLIKNPETLNSRVNNLKDDELNELMKNLVPYEHSVSPGDNRILAFAYTNLREDYLMKFLTTGLVSFMYRRAGEFNIMPHKDPETKENVVAREVINKFLASMFEYNPDIHVQECGKAPKTEKEMQQAVAAMKVSDVPNPEKVNLEEAVKIAGSSSVPNDTFAWFRMYQRDNYEALRWATMILYGVLPQVELMVQPCEVFDGENPIDEYKVYEQMHRDALKFSLTATTFGKWSVLGPFQSNKDKVSFLNKDTEILARILEQHKKDEAIGAELLKKRVKERKKENIRREGPDASSLEDHLRDMPPEEVGQTRVLSKDEREKLAAAREESNKATDELAATAADLLGGALAPTAPTDNIKHAVEKVSDAVYNDDQNPPENALTVNVFTTDKKKGLQKSHFFTEAVDPNEEKNQTDERFKELKAAEEAELARKREAEKTVKAKAAAKKGGSRRK